MSRGNDGLWNTVSIFFLVATVIAVVTFAVIGFTGGSPQQADEPIPTAAVLPTLTPTPPPTATFTPLPPTETATGTATDFPTNTPRPTDAPTLAPSPIPSATITASPSPTETLSVTLTNTPEPTATGPTAPPPPPYPFAAQPAQFTRNFANTAGCAWQGIGGQVLGLDGAAYTNTLQVHVYSQQQDFGRVFTGTNSAYGVSGFEVRVANAITAGIYFVQLESRANIAISDAVQVTFPGDCEQNAAIINFEQVRPL